MRNHAVEAVAVALFSAALVLAAAGEARFSVWLAAAAVLLALVKWLETGPASAKELALVATLAGVAAAGRLLFTALPGVQPVTVIVIAAGAALGARAGLAVGLLAPFVSNFFLAHGAWTPFQMLGWGACGLLGAALAPLLRSRAVLAVVAAVAGFAFSFGMDVWQWFAFWPHTWTAFAAVTGRGLPFDVAHAVGNVVLVFVAGAELRRLLDRYGRRLRVEVVWA